LGATLSRSKDFCVVERAKSRAPLERRALD